MRTRAIVGLCWLVAACGGAKTFEASLRPVQQSAPSPTPACAEAAKERAAASDLAKLGRLAAAATTLEAAVERCPGDRSASLALLVTTLTELGRERAARAAIAAIDADGSAPPEAKRAAADATRALDARAKAIASADATAIERSSLTSNAPTASCTARRFRRAGERSSSRAAIARPSGGLARASC